MNLLVYGYFASVIHVFSFSIDFTCYFILHWLCIMYHAITAVLDFKSGYCNLKMFKRFHICKSEDKVLLAATRYIDISSCEHQNIKTFKNYARIEASSMRASFHHPSVVYLGKYRFVYMNVNADNHKQV